MGRSADFRGFPWGRVAHVITATSDPGATSRDTWGPLLFLRHPTEPWSFLSPLSRMLPHIPAQLPSPSLHSGLCSNGPSPEPCPDHASKTSVSPSPSSSICPVHSPALLFLAAVVTTQLQVSTIALLQAMSHLALRWLLRMDT